MPPARPPQPGSSSSSGPGPGPDRRLAYAERLWPSATTWLLVPLFAALAGLAGAGLGLLAGVVGAVLGAVATLAGLLHASARVEVSVDGGLRAGRARVPAVFLDGGEAGRGDVARLMRGPHLDARTYLCLRGWVDGVALVHLDDPQDPTPAWLISTRHPEALVAAVEGVSSAASARGEEGPDRT